MSHQGLQIPSSILHPSQQRDNHKPEEQERGCVIRERQRGRHNHVYTLNPRAGEGTELTQIFSYEQRNQKRFNQTSHFVVL